MTENPAARGREPERPHQGPEDNPLTAGTLKRSRRKKVRVLVLAAIGLALLVLGFGIYPRRAQAPTPPYAILTVTSGTTFAHDIYEIDYGVTQIHPDLARVSIQARLVGNRLPRRAALSIILNMTGQYIEACFPHPECFLAGSHGKGGRSRGIADFAAPIPDFADAEFLVRTSSFGVTANGVTADLAFPELFADSLARGQQYLSITYNSIPSATSYDWSSDPPQEVWKTLAVWDEPIESPVTFSRTVIGINHAAQQRDSTLTLLAGILFGIGGSALVAAVQEAIRD